MSNIVSGRIGKVNSDDTSNKHNKGLISVTDLHNLKFESSTEHDDIRQSVRKLCEKFPGEYWRELDRSATYPSEFVQAMTEGGFLSVLVPEAYGGSGLGLEAAVAILEEVHASGCNGAACHAQMYTMGTLLRHGSEEQKQKWLPGIASGELRLQAFGVTEPSAGTDTLSIKTTATKEGDRYFINGQKVWTSRAEHSDLMILLARTQSKAEVEKRTDGLSVFLLDMRDLPKEALRIQPIEAMLNHATTEIFFDQCPVPAENLIGLEGKGLRYILDGMNAERILIASECVGDAQWFVRKSRDYANERVVFGRPIAQNQGVQFPIARNYMELEAARLMVYKAARAFDTGEDAGAMANMAKLYASETSWRAADTCLQTHGGFGFASEYDVERKFRETRLYQVAPISTNLILSYLAEHVLGMPRSF